jgi:hypothetical protein
MTKEMKMKLIGAALALTSLGAWAAQADDVSQRKAICLMLW